MSFLVELTSLQVSMLMIREKSTYLTYPNTHSSHQDEPFQLLTFCVHSDATRVFTTKILPTKVIFQLNHISMTDAVFFQYRCKVYPMYITRFSANLYPKHINTFICPFKIFSSVYTCICLGCGTNSIQACFIIINLKTGVSFNHPKGIYDCIGNNRIKTQK